MNNEILEMSPAEIYWKRRCEIAEKELTWHREQASNSVASYITQDPTHTIKQITKTLKIAVRGEVKQEGGDHYHAIVEEPNGRKIAYYVDDALMSKLPKSMLYRAMKKILESQINYITREYERWVD